MHAPLIALTTDFGEGSSYVAQLKGVLYSALPHVRVVDVCHGLNPYDVLAAQVLLRSTAYAFPLGTVHVVVVDPGVGSVRRPVALGARGMFFVGPENGVFAEIAKDPTARVVVLDKPCVWRSVVSATFHGRDVFAPVACELASGMLLEDVGSETVHSAEGRIPQVRCVENGVEGCTLQADRYGNLTTNIVWREHSEGMCVWVQGVEVPVVGSYHEAPAGLLVALVGSDGYVELAVKEASAQVYLNGSYGIPVRCQRIGPTW